MDKLEEIFWRAFMFLVDTKPKKPKGYVPTDMRDVFTNAKLKNV